ncbi:MAG TPA: hypothetical protein VJ866_00465 [Pyrinomonadaceae bacterium]|nr:hypothetical protein [Pyrinomonadaceae bacterium]
MLFVETRTADLNVERRLRTPLLEALRGRGFVPLIRSARRHFFEQAAQGSEAARELERAVEERAETEGEEPYVHGDLFCFEDFANFLVFGAGLRAGVVYSPETAEPSAKLEAFCRSVEEAFGAAKRESDADSAGVHAADEEQDGEARFEWRAAGTLEESGSSGEFEAGQTQRVPPTPERARAVELLEDTAARLFLQRLGEAHADGRAAELVAAGRGPEQESVVTRLAGAGLVKREIQVSCRKEGRSLFRLPSAEALAIVTASNAVCSECGSAVADERAEELVTPTPLANSMLKDGAWLLNSLRTTLAGLGVPERETAPRPASGDSEAQLTANVCGEPFLFVVRDGDFTGAHARRAVEGEAEAQATHLVVVASGKIQDEARARLREHARRRSRSGDAAEVVFVEGLEKIGEELRPVVERVAQEALTRELYELDSDAGFDVGYALAARFRLMRQREGALEDLAASAAGALAGSLREF